MEQTGRRTRREFLRNSITVAAAVGAANVTAQAQSKKPARKTAWPIACRDAHLREVGETDSWSAMKTIGVDGVEVIVEMDGTCPLLFAPERKFSVANADGIKALGDEFRKHDRKITAFCLMNQFDARPDEEVAWVTRTAQAAAKLGVPAIRLDVWPHKIKDEGEFLQFAIRTGKRIVDGTKDLPVRFGVENHGGTTNRPEFTRKMFDGVGSKRFGLTLDTGNFYWFGHPLSKLYDIYAEFAPWVCHTHCKSIRYPEAERDKQRAVGWKYGEYNCPVYEGDIDFRKVVAILRKADYSNDLCIEDESLGKAPQEKRADVLKKEAEFLRKLTLAK
jgi:sugar phosphate isomerase/epimerase